MKNSFLSFFKFFMWWRVFYGSAKFIAGAALLKWATLDPVGIFSRAVRGEVVEDPGDLFIRFVTSITERLSPDTIFFIALYLLFWGAVDAVLSMCIIQKKLWAFPTASVLIGFFVLYETYRVSYTHSLVLASIIVVDIVIIWFIQKEYKILKTAQQRGVIDTLQR